MRRASSEAEPTIDQLWWGFRPAWAGGDVPQPINARVETVATSRYFRGAFLHHRCVIPANGWYEWLPMATGKQPHFLCREDRDLLWFAGVWAEYADGSACCAIITEPARGAARDVHDRMPLALEDARLAPWLDAHLQDRDVIRAAVHHIPADQVTHWAVSPRVNRPVNEGAELIEAIG